MKTRGIFSRHSLPDSSEVQSSDWIVKPSSIVLAAVVLFILIFSINLFLGWRQLEERKRITLNDDKTTASLLTYIIMERNRATIEILQSYAHRHLFVTAVKNKDVAGVHRHMSDLKKNVEIDLTFVTDKRGFLWVNFPIFPEAIGKDLSSRDWYKGISSNWTPYISTVFKLIVGDKPLAAAFCVPIFDEKEMVVGILATSQRLGFLEDINRRLPLDHNIKVSIIDQKGQILYSNKYFYKERITDYRLFPIVEQALKAKKQQIEISDPQENQEKIYLTIVPVENSGWSVIIERPLKDIFRLEISSFIVRSIISFLLFLLIASFLVYLRKVFLFRKTEELHQAEVKLLHGEERNRNILKTAMDGFWAVDMQGNLLEVNDAYSQMSGYSEQELLAMRISDLETGENADEIAAHLQKVIAIGEDRFESRHRRKDGTIFDVEISVQYQTTEGGRMVAFLRDITERKKAEESVRESESSLRTVLDSTPFPVALVDVHDNIVDFWSQSALTLFGHTAPTAAEWYEIAYPDPNYRREVIERWKTFLEIARESGKNVNTGEYRVTCSDGSVRICELYAAFLAGRLIITFNDITERKQADEVLREKELQYHHMADAGLALIWTSGTDKLCNYFNGPWLKFTGRALEQEIGNGWVEGVHPEDLDRCFQTYIAAFEKRESFDMDYRLRHASGEYRWIRDLGTPNYDGRGAFIGYIGHCFDISDRKRDEEEKRDLEERLNRSEKMESLGLLAGGVAHDLNNVLGIVVGYAELLLDSVDEKSPLRKDLTTIFDGAQKAAAIVEDLLTLARRGVVGKKVLNLNKLIGDFKKSPQWEKLLSYHPHVSIKTDLDPDLLNISASSIHLEKTLYNLVSNAGEAMTKGGTITIKASNRYIDKPISGYDTINEGDYVVLSVSDEGDGISETDLKRIFEPFYTKKIMGRSGTGLGLSVVWGTVKDHQGYIDVQSEEGKGTTFTLYFLITREDIAEEGLAVSMSEYQGNGESILIVDDVKDQRDLAARLLTSLNYSVSTVSSGEDAIKYLKEHKLDLLVLDMIMDPGMDGLDTYKSVLEITPQQKAIIVSGFSESDRVKKAKALGAGAYVKKPYIKEKLGMAVKKELARK